MRDTSTREFHSAPAGPVSSPERARQKIVLAICLATGFATLLDQSVLNVAVPALRAELGAGRADVQWILAGYSLTFGLALVPAGRLGDARGRRGLLIAGLGLFGVASVIGVLAVDPWMLVLARLLQGIGAGTANPQVIGLIQDTFTGAARVRALGAYAAVGSLSAIAGPVAGGAVLGLAGPALGWRLAVALSIPFGLVTCLLAARYLPHSDRPPRRAHLDVVGTALLGLVTVCVLLPVIGVGGAGPVVVAGWLAAAVLAGAVLVGWERRTARQGGTPILLPALFASRGFVLGTVVAMCWFGSALGLGLVVTLFLQEGLGLSPLVAGLCTLPAAVAMGISSTLGWRVVGRYGRRSVTWMLGLLVATLAAMLLLVGVLPAGALLAAVVLSQLLTGAAGGLITSPNQALTLAHAPPGANGLAAGFFQVSQRIASTLCLAAAGGVFVAVAAPGDLATYRLGFSVGILLSAVLALVALVASLLDRSGTAPRLDPAQGGGAPEGTVR
ncbi:MFS transporter [Pseudonocardia aurantiaca]|uniref:MFS transporter n=1 Tax=Pseudonocardia aurantiaca TaxID=75290 RepID=A0ABW4FKU8_9PSEU